MKKVKVILSPEAEEVFNYLNEQAPTSKNEEVILKALKKKIELIKDNVHFGDSIKKKLIPREYVNKYEVNNLFRVELPNYWRMLYTLTNGDSQIEVIAFVLDLINHEEYNKKFGYKKR